MSCCLFIVVGLVHFFLWYLFGRWLVPVCNNNSNGNLVNSIDCLHSREQSVVVNECSALRDIEDTFIVSVATEIISKYRLDHLSELKLPALDTLVLSNHRETTPISDGLQGCASYINPLVSIKQSACFAVAFVNDKHAYNLQRIHMDEDEQHEEEQEDAEALKPQVKNIDSKMEYGFFNKVAKSSHRSTFNSVMLQFLQSHSAVRSYVANTLTQHAAHPGDDVIAMVVNEGEIDLFMNYVCSLHVNNVTNPVYTAVFVTSASLVPIVQSIGPRYIALYHKQFVKVGRDANEEYLDEQFGRIMWYKLFCNWLLLELGYNMLYQDVDIIWFQNAFLQATSNSRESLSHSYELHAQEQVMRRNTSYDGYFSDDGQRNLRFSPFYINSGFYYLKSNSRTKYFTWSALAAYDYLLVTSSHQFLFNIKLLESLDFARISPAILNLNSYPTGIKFNHDKPYMKGLREGIIKPYLFHMCWTVNKDQKINNFKSIDRWYVKGECASVSKMYTRPSISRFQDCCGAM